MNARLAILLALLLPVSARAEREPANGCLLAAASARQALRYLHPGIPARILLLRSADGRQGHAALVYHLDPEGWVIYEDTFGSRPLRRLCWPNARTFPPALAVARLAFPAWPVGQACWLPPAPR